MKSKKLLKKYKKKSIKKKGGAQSSRYKNSLNKVKKCNIFKDEQEFGVYKSIFDMCEPIHIEKELGKGTFNEAYKVKDKNLVLKILKNKDTKSNNKKFHFRHFENEFNARKIQFIIFNTLNIVPEIFDFGLIKYNSNLSNDCDLKNKTIIEKIGSYSCFTYSLEELFDEDLLQHFEFNINKRKFTLTYVLNIIVKIVDCIRLLHSELIVHRDIKLNNFVLKNNSVKVIDFGLSTMYPNKTSHPFLGRLAGFKVGTKDYMAPELKSKSNNNNNPQLNINHESNNYFTYQSKADVYAIGITLQRILKSYNKQQSNNKKNNTNNKKIGVLNQLIDSMLVTNPLSRPDMETIHKKLLKL